MTVEALKALQGLGLKLGVVMHMDVPPSPVCHLEFTKALHERIVVLTVKTAQVPYVTGPDRLIISEIAPSF